MSGILVVDDDHSLTDLMRFLLQPVSKNVAAVHNGKQALHALGVEPKDDSVPLPSVVLLDVMMPEMDGFSTLVRIRQNPRTSKLPVIVMTAKSNTEDLFEHHQPEAFFRKPFEPDLLRAAVAKAAQSGPSGPSDTEKPSK